MANYYNDFTLSQLDVLGSGREGILFRDDFAPLDPTVRTLVIGLGGMGVKTLCRLKQTIREKLGRIDEGSLRFLAIDTDGYEREQSLSSGLLTAEEFLFLDGSGLNHAFMLPPDQQPHYLKGILPDAPLPLPMMFHGMGAGQIRLSGRLSLLEANCYGAVMKGIVTAFSKLDQNPHRRLEVWIVAGLGGGTGSGMVIDIPYLVRKVASHLGVRGNLKLKGQIYLPNVYDTGRNGIPNVGYLDAAYRNGYAALKEIDYYMTLQNSGNTFDAEYADGPYSSSENIFDRCTLIGGHDSVGDNALNPKEEAIRCCVQDLLCKITETRITDVAPTFAQWADHPYIGVFSPFQMVLDAERSPFSWYGNYKFSFAGEASLEIPHKAVADRFLGMVFESLHGKLRQNADRVTEGAVAAFEDSVPSPSRIVQKAAADFVLKLERLLDDPDYHWTKAKLLAHDRDGVLEDCMNRELDRFTREFRLEDLVSDVNAQAESVFRDIDRGPYYLERLLTAGHSDGGGVGFFRRLARYAEEVMLLRDISCDRFNKVDADREAICAVAAR
ncbi:MAG: hypothetical protein IIW31_04815, partial [Clostridia bacterium]|nr:hypothetical protein [Clostridia bacterium]